MPQELRAEHGRQRQGTERRKENRPNHHRHEFPEQKPRGTAQGKHRHEHRHQHHRSGNHRKETLVGSRHGSLLRVHTLLYLVVNVFHNHNSIVHHKANGKHHGKQGQHVNREPAQIKHKETSHHRDWHHHHGDKGGAGLPQEGEDNGNHQQECNKDGLHHFLDRGADIDGGIATIEHLHAFGNFPTDILYTLVKLVGDFHMVRARLRHQGQGYRILAITTEPRAGILRFIVDVGHVGTADDGTVGGGLHRNILKGLRVQNSAQGANRKGGLATFDRTRRQFQVALTEGRRHLRARHAQSLQADRVNPEAHCRALLAPDSHFGDAIDGLQAFFHKVIRYFGNFHRVELIAHKAHHQNRVVVTVGLVDRRFIYVVRKPAAHTAHTVTDFVGGRLQIHARFEFNVDERKTIAACRGKGLDARSTVDGGFQDLGNFGLHHGGVCARVRGSHLNQRVVYVGVFTHAQVRRTEKAQQQDDQGNDGHQNWAADRELADAHQSTS